MTVTVCANNEKTFSENQGKTVVLLRETEAGQEGKDVKDVITYQNLNLGACGQDWKRFIQLQGLEERTQLLFQNVNEVKLGLCGQ